MDRDLEKVTFSLPLRSIHPACLPSPSLFPLPLRSVGLRLRSVVGLLIFSHIPKPELAVLKVDLMSLVAQVTESSFAYLSALLLMEFLPFRRSMILSSSVAISTMTGRGLVRFSRLAVPSLWTLTMSVSFHGKSGAVSRNTSRTDCRHCMFHGLRRIHRTA